MKLNQNFDQKIKPLIESSEELTKWFERNQEWMAYFELVHAGCDHFDNTTASFDIVVLSKMANACLSRLEIGNIYDKDTKVDFAVKSMAEIYEENKYYLTETAAEKFKISYNVLDDPGIARVNKNHK